MIKHSALSSINTAYHTHTHTSEFKPHVNSFSKKKNKEEEEFIVEAEWMQNYISELVVPFRAIDDIRIWRNQ